MRADHLQQWMQEARKAEVAEAATVEAGETTETDPLDLSLTEGGGYDTVGL